jgi:WD40 repeat protein
MIIPFLLLVVGQQPLEWQLYQASIAAASGAIRLNETAVAQRWLHAAPAAHRGWEWSYLHGLAHQSAAVIKAHDAPITGIATSPNGELLATTSADKSVKLWDSTTGQLITTLTGHTSAVWSPAFRPGSNELATIGSDGTIRIWDIETHSQRRVIEKVGQGLGAVAYSPDGALLAATSWTFEKGQGVKGWVHLWRADGELVWKTEYGVKPIPAVQFRPGGRQLAVATWDGWIGLFPIPGDGKPSAEIRITEPGGSYHAMQGLAYSPDGRTLASASKDNMVRYIDSSSGKVVKEIPGHTGFVNGVLFSTDGKWSASGSSDGTLRLWDAVSGASIAVLREHTASIAALAVTPSRVVTAAADGTLRWWDAQSAGTSALGWKHGASTYGFDFSPDGRRAASAAWGGSLKMWDTQTGAVLWEKPVHDQSANRVVFSPDGQRLASGGNDGRLRITSASTGEILATWEEIKDGRGAAIAWSPDGRTVFCPSSRPSGKLWDAATGQSTHTVSGGKGEIYAAQFPPDSRLLAVGWTGGQAKLVARDTGADVALLDGHPGGIYALAFHPSGKQLATGGADRMIRVWSVPDGKLLRTLSGHTELVHGLDYSPDGSRLASSSNDMTVRIWAGGAADPLLSIPFPVQVYGVKFSPDGRRLATLPLDGSISFLDAGR